MDNSGTAATSPNSVSASSSKRQRTDHHAPGSTYINLEQANINLSKGVTYNFIRNTFVLSKSRTWSKVHDPASQTFITRVPESTSAEIQNAVVAAEAAQPNWAALSPSKRRSRMLSLISIIRQNSLRIRHCLCFEVGKTVADADAEFERGLDALETACAVSIEMSGLHVQNQAAEIHTINQPLGVCLTISPFNFPFLIPLWSIPYAILAGNAVVLKPSEKTPSASQILAECFLRAEFPAGVFNIVHGGAGVVNGLLAQPIIQAINFVGSDVAGEPVYEHARATRKRIQAEFNGKNHGVVLEDAHKTKALYAIAGSAFGAAGQRCMAISVVIFVGTTSEWLPDLGTLADSLSIGSGLDPSNEVGPLITAESKRRVENLITQAENEGATVVLDGRNYSVPDFPNGNFVGPTILTNVKPYMSCYQEEIFGPVLCCMEASTMEEAMEIINDNKYGNGCSLFTNSPASAQTFQRCVNVGQIGINVPILAPSGPILRTANKDSFLGDIRGGLWQFFTKKKTVTAMWH